MKYLNNISRVLFIVSLLVANGCALFLVAGGAAAGAGTIAYIKGELKAIEEASFDHAWEATQSAIEDMEFFVTSREKDAVSAELKARGAGDKKVTVKLEKVTPTLTELRIRVGVFGDESLSRQILEKIRQYL